MKKNRWAEMHDLSKEDFPKNIEIELGNLRIHMRFLMSEMDIEQLKRLRKSFDSQLEELTHWLEKPTDNPFEIG